MRETDRSSRRGPRLGHGDSIWPERASLSGAHGQPERAKKSSARIDVDAPHQRVETACISLDAHQDPTKLSVRQWRARAPRACGGRGWWRGMGVRVTGHLARLRRHPGGGGLWPRRRGKRTWAAAVWGDNNRTFSCLSRPRPQTRLERGEREGDKDWWALPRRFRPLQKVSANPTVFVFYQASPIFFTFRSRRSEPS